VGLVVSVYAVHGVVIQEADEEGEVMVFEVVFFIEE